MCRRRRRVGAAPAQGPAAAPRPGQGRSPSDGRAAGARGEGRSVQRLVQLAFFPSSGSGGSAPAHRRTLIAALGLWPMRGRACGSSASRGGRAARAGAVPRACLGSPQRSRSCGDQRGMQRWAAGAPRWPPDEQAFSCKGAQAPQGSRMPTFGAPHATTSTLAQPAADHTPSLAWVTLSQRPLAAQERPAGPTIVPRMSC